MAIFVKNRVIRCPDSIPTRFDSIKETVCTPTRSPSVSTELIGTSRLRCQSGGTDFAATRCYECRRFVGYRPSENYDQLTVTCYWNENDRVRDVMTLAAELVTIDSSADIDEAKASLDNHGIDHLLVVDASDVLVGILSRTDLTATHPPQTVTEAMTQGILVVEPEMLLGGALDLMVRCKVRSLPVAIDGRLCGIITLGDLRRLGIDDSTLHSAKCAGCGYRVGTRDTTTGNVTMCATCQDQTFSDAELDDY